MSTAQFWETVQQVGSITANSVRVMESQCQSSIDFELDQIRMLEEKLSRRVWSLEQAQKNPDVGASGLSANKL